MKYGDTQLHQHMALKIYTLNFSSELRYNYEDNLKCIASGVLIGLASRILNLSNTFLRYPFLGKNNLLALHHGEFLFQGFSWHLQEPSFQIHYLTKTTTL